MSEYQIISVLAGFGFLYSLLATRLERTPISGAFVFVAAGVLCSPACLKWISLDVDAEGISLLAELTLAVVLFADSANTDLKVLRKFETIPARLLLIGLPLTIAFGFGVGVAIFPNLSWVEVALLATLLAPTDAALGKAVVTNEAVPASVRESLNVESGLNDGICVPVLLLFLAVATGEAAQGESLGLAIKLPVQAIGIGAVVGLALGTVGSKALKYCYHRSWIGGSWMQFPVVTLALLCFGLAQWQGGSGFIASFVGGMTFGAMIKKQKHEVLEAAEGVGDALAMLTWFTFGTLLLSRPPISFDWRIITYAIASLTVVRMLPVFLCVSGMQLDTSTKLFIGWFGPRGLASIVFAVMVLNANLPGGSTLVAVAAWTIVLSVVLHGISANPLSSYYSSHQSGGAAKLEPE